MWGEGGVCSWQQGPGCVLRVSYEPCMWHLKDPPVPCNPGNLLAEGEGGRGAASQPWSYIPLCILESGLG